MANEIYQSDKGSRHKMLLVFIIMLLLILLGAMGLLFVLRSKDMGLNNIFYPENPGVNDNSNPNNGSNGNNTQNPEGSGDNTTPPLQPIRDVVTTTTSTTNPAPDSPPGQVNPNTGANNTPPNADNPGGTAVDGNLSITSSPPTNPGDNTGGGIRP